MSDGYTVVLSGPKSSDQQARTALAGAGYNVDSRDHDHGLTELADGTSSDGQAVAFVTVTADHPDGPAAVVQPLGWVLRMHHPTPEPELVSDASGLLARLDEMQREINALKGQVG